MTNELNYNLNLINTTPVNSTTRTNFPSVKRRLRHRHLLP